MSLGSRCLPWVALGHLGGLLQLRQAVVIILLGHRLHQALELHLEVHRAQIDVHESIVGILRRLPVGACGAHDLEELNLHVADLLLQRSVARQ